MSMPEKQHIIEAFQFELGKCLNKEIQQQVVDMYANVDHFLAEQIALGLGLEVPEKGKESVVTDQSSALSQLNTPMSAKTRKVAILAHNGFNGEDLMKVLKSFDQAGIMAEIVSNRQGKIKSVNGAELKVDQTFLTTDSVLYDAVFIATGQDSVNALKKNKKTSEFLLNAFNHYKAIGAPKEGADLMKAFLMESEEAASGVVTSTNTENMDHSIEAFIQAVAKHRHWDRQI